MIGAGIYGTLIALRLHEDGHLVRLFDELGLLSGASAINQFRVHAGYHYPRSHETIEELQHSRTEFLDRFAGAIVSNSSHFYAIPQTGSQTSPEDFVATCERHGLGLRPCWPQWMDFDYIAKCWEVDEQVYDPDALRSILQTDLSAAGIEVERRRVTDVNLPRADTTVWATYGRPPSMSILQPTRVQVAEKVLVRLPEELRHIALVVVDGPFTAFDPYGASELSMFGSARYTNHWTSTKPGAQPPKALGDLLYAPTFSPCEISRFDLMREHAALVAPSAAAAEYIGSRFALRVVEDASDSDRRQLHIVRSDNGHIHVFSGKVVAAVQAARLVSRIVADEVE